ncbi:OmpH family outer membrane protein [Adhaeretor mobilis]|uniref:Periplasmic chaperone n=1 Tax=Adhaeretor mobilis TaxID=1930276 RepID=A0A517MU84_9BACT|nr:OmpH family outer membrane protein [Adhaeretor mobilis]QDS98439.1 periplasmic chaperone [Adhaeretor mobilis]
MRTLLLSTLVCGLVASQVSSVFAQNPAGAKAKQFGVAVVDVSYVFKEYPRFTQQMEGMKKEMETAEGLLKSDRERIQQQQEQRDASKPGTDTFKRLDEELARSKADFNIKAGGIRRDFLEREAKVYYQTYLEVNNAVKSYAEANNIGLVFRWNGNQIDPTKRDDVLRAISQPIVHQNYIDITPDILAGLQAGGGAIAPTARRTTSAR